MIALTLTPAAYKALKAIRSGTYDAPADSDGMFRIWIDRDFVDRLARTRSSGESYSEVILRLARARP